VSAGFICDIMMEFELNLFWGWEETELKLSSEFNLFLINQI
jgi:hypothetical protein